MYERTDDTPWAAVPLLDDTKPTLWFETDVKALKVISGKPYTLQYRPRRRKIKPKVIKTD